QRPPNTLDDQTASRFFNTAAFAVPPSATFGNAGRKTSPGPGTSDVNLGLTRNVPLGGNRVLSVQILASNVFTALQFAAIDTVVNSPTFGQVLAARAPRRIQISTRFRF